MDIDLTIGERVQLMTLIKREIADEDNFILKCLKSEDKDLIRITKKNISDLKNLYKKLNLKHRTLKDDY